MDKQAQKKREKEKAERVSKRNPTATRAALLKAAGEVLVDKGLSGFHVHLVAEKAGYGKPLIYRYFGDRTQVLNALAYQKAEEVQNTLSKAKMPTGLDVSEAAFRQISFARTLAGDPVLRWLFRASLTGEVGAGAAKALDDLVPKSGAEGEEAAAEAFLLAGISYVLLLKDSQDTCAGVPISTPNDLAAFERAFVRLSSQI